MRSRSAAIAISKLRPEIVVLLGDRFELFSPVIASLLFRNPFAHIHGGERSEGPTDEAVRHAITKMSSIHFAATASYRRRIIQMGESPRSVHNFGAPGLDQLHTSRSLTRRELEQELGFPLHDPFALVTYHPVTRDANSAAAQVRCLLAAVNASGLSAVFTIADADGGRGRNKCSL